MHRRGCRAYVDLVMLLHLFDEDTLVGRIGSTVDAADARDTVFRDRVMNVDAASAKAADQAVAPVDPDGFPVRENFACHLSPSSAEDVEREVVRCVRRVGLLCVIDTFRLPHTNHIRIFRCRCQAKRFDHLAAPGTIASRGPLARTCCGRTCRYDCDRRCPASSCCVPSPASIQSSSW